MLNDVDLEEVQQIGELFGCLINMKYRSKQSN